MHPVPVLSLHDKLRIPTRTKLENSSAAVRHLVDQGRRDDDKESQVAEVGSGEGGGVIDGDGVGGGVRYEVQQQQRNPILSQRSTGSVRRKM